MSDEESPQLDLFGEQPAARQKKRMAKKSAIAPKEAGLLVAKGPLTRCQACREKFLRDKEVAARYDVSRPTIHRWVKNEDMDFPKPVRLSPGTSRWKMSDLVAYEASLAFAQHGEAEPPSR